ncbi:ImmA/IrrE family metallo-endopeptidase [Streptomyces sp. P9-2B-2]|uniref:ImmA/IrrE family metallo-endopeptidase n=1 Tax=Streptomyces sp. P9-2B-2 TaxID=3057114 RepID=UPI0025B5E234|nr:ImmA/IrrE family metallo-endopeptidase [Streptomyces sp. P9-2B-2]WJY35904.1 ImmA/IrrE family metallo-endopeptidase [Streptomyces sp. P9-2B-2]
MRPSAKRVGALSTRHFKHLRHACQDFIDDLGLPPEFTIPMVAERLGERRGRPIVLAPLELGAGSLYGLWLATATADVIAYESRTTRLHRHHIIAHELAHIVYGHRGSHLDGDSSDLYRLFPDLDPALVRGTLARSTYADHQEREAETMASLLLMAASRRPPAQPERTAPEAAELLARLEHSLGRTGRGPG